MGYYQKSHYPPTGYSAYVDELLNQLNTAVISYASVCILQAGAFRILQKISYKLDSVPGGSSLFQGKQPHQAAQPEKAGSRVCAAGIRKGKVLRTVQGSQGRTAQAENRKAECCVLFPGGRTGADRVKLTQFLPLPQKQAFVSSLQSKTTSANPTLPVLKSSSAPLRLIKIGALIFSPDFATVGRSKERAFEQKEKLWRRRALHHRKNRMDFTAI